MHNTEETLTYLKAKATYALNSKKRENVYEAYGMVRMARKLGAISFADFLELNQRLIRDGINNPAAGLE